jgi:hypothetical protein
LTFACGALAGFLISLAPLAIWNWRYFIDRGPFAIQADYLPLWLAVISVVMCCYLAQHAKSIGVVYRYIATMLFAVVFIACMISVFNNGWRPVVLEDGFDISYFCFALPFLILTLDYGTAVEHVSGRMFSTPISALIK